MTPEQLKLIQQLAELGDVTVVKRGISGLINAISEMDIKALELILEDKVSYQDTTKTIFLQKLKEVFKDFQKEDNKLIPYEGKCKSDECSNKNKKGIAFVGNKSGRYINFIIEAPGCAEDIMQTFFWLDEDNRNTFHLFQLVRNPGKCNVSDDKSVRYNDSDEWPAHAPVGMWIDYGLVNEFLREWGLRKEQLKSGEISEDEYFEWKINWPASSSSVDEKGNDKKNNSYQWRKS